MEMKLTDPSKIILPISNDELKRFLTYTDKSVGFLISKLKKNFHWRASDPEAFTQRLNDLKKNQTKTLIFQNEEGQFWTYSGLSSELYQRFKWGLENNIRYPDSKALPWAKMPEFEPRYYQKEAVEALIKARHGAISIPTGGGKSYIIKLLVKYHGLQTLIMAPSAAITEQLYNDLVESFGKKHVGQYGDGKKEFKKRITIAVAQSLTKLAPDSPIYKQLSKSEVFISDESHTVPAETFEQVCMKLVSQAPYRYFVSATQTRNDGSEMVLKGVTGPIVYSKSFNELVKEGFLSPIVFKTFKVPTIDACKSDPKTETRNNLYANPYVTNLAADIANKSVMLADRPTVILIEELRQFENLYPKIKVPFEFVHGGASQDAKKYLQPKFWKSDREGAIKRFNSGETKLLIGTSAISVGVDIKPTACIIYLQGGVSGIKVPQAIGRGTRLSPNKQDCWIVDFNVQDSPVLNRHYETRKLMYESMGTVEEY